MTERNSHGNYNRTPQSQWQTQLHRPDSQEEKRKDHPQPGRDICLEQAAKSWLKRREDALKRPDGLERAVKAKMRKSVADCINKHIDVSPEGFGKSKSQMLSFFSDWILARLPSKIYWHGIS